MSDLSSGIRLLGIDIARTLAIVGMLAVHLVPGVRAGAPTWSATVAGGRSAALFAVLAGVGLTLSARSYRRSRAAAQDSRLRAAVTASVLVRAALVGVLGLTLTALPSGLAVILPSYALLFVLAVPLLSVPTRWLVVLAVLAATATPVLSQLVREVVPPRSGEQPTVLWLARPVDLLVDLGITGYYPALTWSTYLIAGLIVGRLPLHAARTARLLVGAGAVLAVLGSAGSALLLGPAGGLAALRRSVAASGGDPAGLALRLTQTSYGTTPTDSWWWLAVRTQHSGTSFDLLHTTGTALVAIGGCLLVARAVGGVAGRTGTVLAAAATAAAAPGTMPLTVYTLQVLALAAGLRAGVAGTGSPLASSPVAVWLLYVGVTVAAASVWRSVVGQGPLEALVAGPAAALRDAVAAIEGPEASRSPTPPG